MSRASSWLGYSWELADLVFKGGDDRRKDGVTGSSVEVGILSRREKFRARAGPSREELQWLEILAILRKVSKLQIPVHTAEDDSRDCRGSSLELQPNLSAISKNFETHGRESSAEGGDFLSGGCSEPKLKHMLQQVVWPFDALGDMTSMCSIEIAWDDIPSSADPVVGGGYKSVCRSGTGRLKPRGRKMNCIYEDSKLTDVIWNGSRSDHGDCLGRGERKRWQVEKIASALNSFELKPGATIVDFGCGSGALTLPLAAIFPEFCFVGVDFKFQSIMLLEERARRGNLQNVTGVYGRIEKYSESFDACVALHACGIATDLALLQAIHNGAAYVMSPCCIGKLQIPVEWTLNSTDSGVSFKKIPKPVTGNRFPESAVTSLVRERQHANEGMLASHTCLRSSSTRQRDVFRSPETFDPRGDASRGHSIGNCCMNEDNCRESFPEGWEGSVSSKLAYPRSSWLRNCVSEKEFQVLARAADWSSYEFESFSSRLHSLCKVVLELDRNEASREVGYWTGLYTLSNDKAGTVGVSHVLVGKPP